MRATSSSNKSNNVKYKQLTDSDALVDVTVILYILTPIMRIERRINLFFLSWDGIAS